MSHTCHARHCDTPVPPRIFMCRAHWTMLPKRLQDAVYHEYRNGQERRKDPSTRYLAVTYHCVAFVAKKEGYALQSDYAAVLSGVSSAAIGLALATHHSLPMLVMRVVLAAFALVYGAHFTLYTDATVSRYTALAVATAAVYFAITGG